VGLLLAGVLLPADTAGAQGTGEKTNPAFPPAREIIDRALQRADWIREEGFEDRLICEYTSIREDLGEERQVKWREEILYKVYPVDGHIYYERVAVDGKPLTDEERKQRKEDFRKEIAGQSAVKKDDTEIKFDKELLSRYKSEILGVEAINGRPAYFLAFEPKDGRLPVRRRIDHALNNSRGKIWIDQEDFGVVRVQFELFKPVKLWGGIIGRMGALEGSLEQVRVQGGVWLPQKVDLYMRGRVLFKSFHQQRKLTWRDARFAPKQVASN
jgi:hypothetical protein